MARSAARRYKPASPLPGSRVSTPDFARFFDLSLSLLCTAEGGSNTFDQLNPAWEKTLGWTREELRSRPFTEFIHPDDLEGTFAIIGDMAERGLPAVNFENRYRHKDGSWVWLSWVGTLRDGTFYAAARDISEYRRTLDELERVNRELSHFAYAASHDLQEPLRAITGHLGFVDAAPLDDRSRRSLEHVRDGAEHMQRLLQGLLEYSRVGTAGGTFEATPLAEPVAGALRTWQAQLDAAGAEVEVASDLPVVRVDGVQVRRLVENLLSNALKFRHPERPLRVTVDAERIGGDWALRVRDNGVGLAPERAERAMQIFQRLHRRSQYPGMGVGLALVKRIAQRHGGDAYIEGKPNEGATVTVVLPHAPGGSR